MIRYKLILEEWEDGQLNRRMEESQDKLHTDGLDGEETIGLLLSFVPGWAAARTGCGGLGTVAYMCHYLVSDDESLGLFKALGDAYDDWGASHDFSYGCSVVVDEGVNACDACECDHARKTDQ